MGDLVNTSGNGSSLPLGVGLPLLDDDLAREMRLRRPNLTPAGNPEDALRLPPLGVTDEVREKARFYANSLRAELETKTTHAVIAAWLKHWIYGVNSHPSQGVVNLQQRIVSIILAIEDVTAGAFNKDTAKMAARKFEWLPSGADVFKFLDEYLLTYRNQLAAAEATANAPTKAAVAQEAPPADGRKFSKEEEAERRRYARAKVEELQRDLQANAAKIRPQGDFERNRTLSREEIILSLLHQADSTSEPFKGVAEFRLRGYMESSPDDYYRAQEAYAQDLKEQEARRAAKR